MKRFTGFNLTMSIKSKFIIDGLKKIIIVNKHLKQIVTG
jgi:hypothetical protein